MLLFRRNIGHWMPILKYLEKRSLAGKVLWDKRKEIDHYLQRGVRPDFEKLKGAEFQVHSVKKGERSKRPQCLLPLLPYSRKPAKR